MHKRLAYCMKNEIRKYLSKIGKRGGASGKGASKARSSILAKRAADIRWGNKVLHRDLPKTPVLSGAVQNSPSQKNCPQKTKSIISNSVRS